MSEARAGAVSSTREKKGSRMSLQGSHNRARETEARVRGQGSGLHTGRGRHPRSGFSSARPCRRDNNSPG